jgi:hypothetical protein
MPWKRQKAAHNFKGRGFWKKLFLVALEARERPVWKGIRLPLWL